MTARAALVCAERIGANASCPKCLDLGSAEPEPEAFWSLGEIAADIVDDLARALAGAANCRDTAVTRTKITVTPDLLR